MKINNGVDNCNLIFKHSGRSDDTCVCSTIPINFFFKGAIAGGGGLKAPLASLCVRHCVRYSTKSHRTKCITLVTLYLFRVSVRVMVRVRGRLRASSA